MEFTNTLQRTPNFSLIDHNIAGYFEAWILPALSVDFFTAGMLVAAAVISSGNVHDIVGSEVAQTDIWSTCLLAQVVRFVEGYVVWIVDSRLHQIRADGPFNIQFIGHLVALSFSIMTFCGMDSIVRVMGVLCSKGVGSTRALEFCPGIGLF